METAEVLKKFTDILSSNEKSLIEIYVDFVVVALLINKYTDIHDCRLSIIID